jgi:hypothetical protein
MAAKNIISLLLLLSSSLPLHASNSSPFPDTTQQTFVDLLALVIAASSVVGERPPTTVTECRQHAHSTLEILSRHLSTAVDGEFVMNSMSQVHNMFQNTNDSNPLFELMKHTHHLILQEKVSAPNGPHRDNSSTMISFPSRNFVGR